jgi:hypothetical protein
MEFLFLKLSSNIIIRKTPLTDGNLVQLCLSTREIIHNKYFVQFVRSISVGNQERDTCQCAP